MDYIDVLKAQPICLSFQNIKPISINPFPRVFTITGLQYFCRKNAKPASGALLNDTS